MTLQSTSAFAGCFSPTPELLRTCCPCKHGHGLSCTASLQGEDSLPEHDGEIFLQHLFFLLPGRYVRNAVKVCSYRLQKQPLTPKPAQVPPPGLSPFREADPPFTSQKGVKPQPLRELLRSHVEQGPRAKPELAAPPHRFQHLHIPVSQAFWSTPQNVPLLPALLSIAAVTQEPSCTAAGSSRPEIAAHY